jgi:hypothetical protein
MKLEIEWALLVDTHNPPKAMKIAKRLSEAVRLKFTNVKAEPYWKDAHFIRIVAHSEAAAASPGDAFLELMRSCSGVADSWTINGPIGAEDNWEFGGAAAPGTIKLPGIESISFNARASVVPISSQLESQVFYAYES